MRWSTGPGSSAGPTCTSRDARRSVEETRNRALLADFPEIADVAWAEAAERELDESKVDRNPRAGVPFAELPAVAADKRMYARWQSSLADFLYRTERLEILLCDQLDQSSRPGEGEREFRIRLGDAARLRRDEAVAKVRERFGSELARLEKQRARALERVDKERAEASQQKWDSVLSIGSSIAGALFGRRKLSQVNVTRARSAARSISRSGKGSVGHQASRRDLGRARRGTRPAGRFSRERGA